MTRKTHNDTTLQPQSERSKRRRRWVGLHENRAGGGETPLELRQQPSVLSFPFVVISFPMKGGFVSMETTMKKTTSPIVREYKIGDITYIVKAVVKDGAKEDAVTKVRRLIQNDLRGKKITNNFEPA